MLYHVAVLAILSWIFRFYFLKNAWLRFDSYGHLYFSKAIAAKNKGPFSGIEANVVGAAPYYAPMLWNWMVSLLSLRLLKKYNRYINPVIDTIFTLTIYGLSLWLGFEAEQAFLVSLLYLTTPMWFSRLAIGPRVQDFTPRLSSEVFTNIFFFFALGLTPLPAVVSITLAACVGAFIVLSSKFGVQVLLFITPLLSLLLLDIYPVIALCLAFLLAILITGGRFIDSLKAQLQHLIWYCKKNFNGDVAISNRNAFYKISKCYSPAQGFLSNFIAVSYSALALNSFTSVLLKLPVLMVLLMVVSFAAGTGHSINWVYFMPVLAAVIVYFLINIKWLLFLGEAERYLNHVALFLCLSLVDVAFTYQLSWLVYAVIIYGVLFYLFEIKYQARILRIEPERQQCNEALVSGLNKVPETLTVLCYPYHIAGGVWRLLFETHHKALFCFMVSEEFSRYFEATYAAGYPYVRLDKLDQLQMEFGVNVAIISVAERPRGWQPPLQWQKLSSGNKYFEVYVHDAVAAYFTSSMDASE